MLKSVFIELVNKHSGGNGLSKQLWKEVKNNYSAHMRYFHNLHHLECILEELIKVKDLVEDWDTLLFSLYYHDFCYSSTSNNNEEKSAAHAGKRLLQMGYPISKTVKCREQILATKYHHDCKGDGQYLCDADLIVLGKDWSEYSQYKENIRKEYSIYPDIMYKNGRKKIIRHFLEMEKIFNTKVFFEQFEKNARRNLEKELAGL